MGKLTLENEFFTKGLPHSLSRSQRDEKSSPGSSLIRDIRRGCRLMKLSRSSFYYKTRAKSPECLKAEADLRDRIEAICLEFPHFGYRRITEQLK